MKISLALLAAALLGASALTQAHTHLKEAQPAEGSVLTAPPANIVLKFSAAARVTALTLQKDGGAEEKLAPLPAAAAAEISVPAGKLAPGKYVVNYRVVSADNHIMSGKLHFTVDPSATPSTGKAPAHDHSHEKH
jgi:methionine-rich copper-binding protein CopC